LGRRCLSFVILTVPACRLTLNFAEAYERSKGRVPVHGRVQARPGQGRAPADHEADALRSVVGDLHRQSIHCYRCWRMVSAFFALRKSSTVTKSASSPASPRARSASFTRAENK